MRKHLTPYNALPRTPVFACFTCGCRSGWPLNVFLAYLIAFNPRLKNKTGFTSVHRVKPLKYPLKYPLQATM